MNIVLLTGHRKSGTTMLHKLFDGHPDATVYPVDVSLLYAFFPCFSATLKYEEATQRIRHVLLKSLSSIDGNEINDRGVILNVNQFLNFFLCRIDDSIIESREMLMTALASAWCDYGGFDPDQLFVMKETSQAIHLQTFLLSKHNYKLINLVRDPRDNYAAIKAGIDSYYSQMGEGELEALSSVINRSRMDLLSGACSHIEFPDNFFSLKFENLTIDVEESMKKVAEFCGLKYHECMCIPTTYGQPFEGNSHEGERFSGVTKKNVGRWNERISDFEAMVIEFWMEDAMKIWGYQPVFTKTQSAEAFAKFYDWYNCRYFYYDSFA